MSKTFTLSESFKARANTACFWEAWVGACLSRMGLETRHMPMVLDGNPAKEDLIVCQRNGHSCWWGHVEVKSVNLVFNNSSDYPHDTVLICSLNSYMRKANTYDGVLKGNYLIVSRETGSIVWAPYDSVTDISETYDSDRGELYKTVTVAKSDLRDFVDFVEQFQ